MPEKVRLRVGDAVWWDGASWDLEALTGPSARLRRGDQVCVVSIDSLRTTTSPDAPQSGSDETGDVLTCVRLASLTPRARARLEQDVAAMVELMEPDPDVPLRDRLRAKASELGVSVRTLERRLSRYEREGPAGLIDSRMLHPGRRAVDPRWDEACRQVLTEYTNASNPTRGAVVARTNRVFLEEVPDGVLPSERTARRRVNELDKGRYTFGAAKQRRSVAQRPQGVYGRLQADRPGEFLVMDSTRLDVFAMEPITLRWVNLDLTVAMDLQNRRITGLSLRPVAARSTDVAGVLYQTMTPQRWGSAVGADDQPPMVPDSIVVDHGKVYLSEHVASICRRFGISIQPAIPGKPTDKPTLERFFKTLRQQLLARLPAYKGPDVFSRGKDVEGQAFLYVSELEQILREWVGIYHHTPHAGLVDARLPQVPLSPAEMFARGVAQAGCHQLPVGEDLVRELLQVEWRTIQHYGIEIRGKRYNGAGLNRYRGRRSSFGGAHGGKWPFMVDADDVRWVYFKDPDEGVWHRLEWEHATGLDAPFSEDAAAYTRRLSVEEKRFVDPSDAVAQLLSDWSKQQVTNRRDRNLAVRLSAQRAHRDLEEGEELRDAASDVGVIDLLQHRARRAGPALTGDPDDVFDAYYAEHPDGGLEVFDD